MHNILCKIEKAECSIILTDDFVDETTIDILSLKKNGVKVKVFSRNKLQANIRNIRRRSCFKDGFEFFETSGIRDRYLLIDGKFLYIMTRGLKYNGKRDYCYIRILGFDEVERLKYNLERLEENAKKYYKQF